MKTKIYQVVSSSYETADNYLHQESYTYTDKDKAREKFEALRGSAKIDIEGDEDSEVEYSCSEDDYENRYEGSREVGTEMEYDVIVELKEIEIDVVIEPNTETPCRYTCFDRVLHLIKPVESEEWQKDIVYLMQNDGLASLLDYLVEKNIISRGQADVVYDGIIMWEDLDGNYFEEDKDKLNLFYEALGITEDIFCKYMEQ